MSSDSALVIATNQVPSIKAADGFIMTEPFLAVCRLVLPVVDKLGTAFALVRNDINGNIERLAERAAQDPEHFHRVFAIVQYEMVKNTHGGSSSATKGLLWLKRAMEFTLAILQRIHDEPETSLSKAVTDTYTETLYRYHGFVASSAFYLAFKFLPSRESFITNLGVSPGGDVQQEIQAFVSAFSPILTEIHHFMVEHNLDDPTKV